MSAIFGPAGTSKSFGRKKHEELPEYLKSFGLSAYEYQCGRGVQISRNRALAFGKIMKDFSLSLHAPYYISLSGIDEQKRENSILYIMDSAKAAKAMGAKRIVVHAGSCGKIDRNTALEYSKETLKKALQEMEIHGFADINLCIETMGKTGQLGTLDEVLQICEMDERILPCIDFGHINARTFGGLNGIEGYNNVLDELLNRLGEERAKTFHAHFSKIEYSKPGGEKKHLTFEDKKYGPKFEPLAESIAKRGWSPTFICESAGTQAEDAQKMKNVYDEFLENSEHTN